MIEEKPKRIKLYTSFTPIASHYKKQLSALASWGEFDVYSINSKSEIDSMAGLFEGVTFIETDRVATLMFGKPLPMVSAFIDEMKKHDDDRFIFINSDIIYIPCKKNYIYDTKFTTVFHRYDFTPNERPKPKMYDQGLDMFLLMKKDLQFLPPSLLCIGRCHFDWAIPFHLLKAKVKVLRAVSPYIYHQRHAQNYDGADWRKSCELLMLESGTNMRNKTLQQFNNYVYSVITIQSQKI